jgi:hypothetical protein
MSSLLYKKKISESLQKMNADELKQAWLILEEIGREKKSPVIGNKKKLEGQLARGMMQLDNGEGTDFGSFINEAKKKYGKR